MSKMILPEKDGFWFKACVGPLGYRVVEVRRNSDGVLRFWNLDEWTAVIDVSGSWLRPCPSPLAIDQAEKAIEDTIETDNLAFAELRSAGIECDPVITNGLAEALAALRGNQ